MKKSFGNPSKRIVRLFKLYLVFMFFAVSINLVLEISLRFVFDIPESLDMLGIILFFSVFNILGAIILLCRNYSAKRMGILSLVLGQTCEFGFMKPEWVQNFYLFKIGMESIAPFIISSVIYWFPAWFIPSYAIHKYIVRGRFD